MEGGLTMAWKVKLNRAGVGNILKTGAVPEMVNRTASTIAAGARSRLPDDGMGGEVVVERYTTDRGAAAVIVKHPRAVGLQAKYGILTSAAASAGVTVRGR
ncbi:hypothetical protein NYO98_10460 [Nocardioides sp. STR2]|uniref:Bacteriophage HK97-gp10, tail-component n=1 Tax=Nocardioides pini TaxID=2975053 RepID=A0ABT4CCL2_9ACTN|nr:hypothetical protein [Nocardioides pini]MCY4726700.1 hypothetical protein [Nocardioides pini]